MALSVSEASLSTLLMDPCLSQPPSSLHLSLCLSLTRSLYGEERRDVTSTLPPVHTSIPFPWRADGWTSQLEVRQLESRPTLVA